MFPVVIRSILFYSSLPFARIFSVVPLVLLKCNYKKRVGYQIGTVAGRGGKKRSFYCFRWSMKKAKQFWLKCKLRILAGRYLGAKFFCCCRLLKSLFRGCRWHRRCWSFFWTFAAPTIAVAPSLIFSLQQLKSVPLLLSCQSVMHIKPSHLSIRCNTTCIC